MQKLRLAGGLLGLTAVGLGAFGAHALKTTLLAHDSLETWRTAVLYHLVHAVAILAVAVSGKTSPAVGWAWTVGIVLFSGSLYFLALGGPSWLGPVTPLGGVCFLAGWALTLKKPAGSA